MKRDTKCSEHCSGRIYPTPYAAHFENVFLEENSAVYAGGAYSNTAQSGAPINITMMACEFRRNTASYGGGAALLGLLSAGTVLPRECVGSAAVSLVRSMIR